MSIITQRALKIAADVARLTQPDTLDRLRAENRQLRAEKAALLATVAELQAVVLRIGAESADDAVIQLSQRRVG